MIENAFYIVETSPGWFQSRMTATHFCFSAGNDYQKRLEGITKLVAKYKTEEKILKMQSRDSQSGSLHMSLATKEQYLAQYSDRGHLYDDDIFEAVAKGLKIAQDNDPMKKVRARVQKVLPKKVEKVEEVRKKVVLPKIGKHSAPVKEEETPVTTMKKVMTLRKTFR
jgi:hypothetical protein